MKIAMKFNVWIIFATLSMAQTIVGVPGTDVGSTFNQQFLHQRHTSTTRTVEPASVLHPSVVVFPGDRVIPQFVDGGSWKTSLFFVNLESHPVTFQVLFFKDNGDDMFVSIDGLGLVRQVGVTLDTAGSTEFETSGLPFDLIQGWALISQTTSDTIGGTAIFRQRVFGRPDQEAAVPIVSQFDSHFVLLFDNTAFTTGIAIANPTLNAVDIPVTIRDQSGQIIDQRFISLGPYNHTAFNLPDNWFSTEGIRGAIEFQTSGYGVAALGLRTNGSAFTSFNVLENLNWR